MIETKDEPKKLTYRERIKTLQEERLLKCSKMTIGMIILLSTLGYRFHILYPLRWKFSKQIQQILISKIQRKQTGQVLFQTPEDPTNIQLKSKMVRNQTIAMMKICAEEFQWKFVTGTVQIDFDGKMARYLPTDIIVGEKKLSVDSFNEIFCIYDQFYDWCQNQAEGKSGNIFFEFNGFDGLFFDVRNDFFDSEELRNRFGQDVEFVQNVQNVQKVQTNSPMENDFNELEKETKTFDINDLYNGIELIENEHIYMIGNETVGIINLSE